MIFLAFISSVRGSNIWISHIIHYNYGFVSQVEGKDSELRELKSKLSSLQDQHEQAQSKVRAHFFCKHALLLRWCMQPQSRSGHNSYVRHKDLRKRPRCFWELGNIFNSPLHKLQGEWVQTLGAMISGIFRVDRRYLWLADDRWYLRRPWTNHLWRLSTQIPDIVALKAWPSWFPL